MKAVLDTNVLLSALFTHGLCETLLDACLSADPAQSACAIVLSEHILAEFTRHATAKFGAPASDVKAATDFLRRHSEIVEPVEVPIGTCPDPDDLPVLGTALAGRADALVTGDLALQSLRTFAGIPILSPRAFFDLLP